MRKIKLLIIIFICLFVVNVKADMGPPSIVMHDVIVTNKSGAKCYDDYKKETGEVIAYGKVLSVSEDINGNYIRIYDEKESTSCLVKYVDVSAKSQDFNLNNETVNKLEPVKAVVLAKGGLNMRKGPSVTYSKKLTVPQYAVITLTHKAGTFWYYTTYNGTSGWITAINGYLGIDSSNVLINNREMKIYDSISKMNIGGNNNIGKIPANTEVTNYVRISDDYSDNAGYYVSYNGTKGYISNMYYKLATPGVITILKDCEIYDQKTEKNKKLTANQDLEYTMYSDFRNENSVIYIPSKNGTLSLDMIDYKYVKQASLQVKESGYIGEGLFGEEKQKEVTPKPTNNDEPKVEPVIEKEDLSTRDIIIIGLLAAILLALTALVIIKLVNKKKSTVKNDEPVINKVSDEEIAKAREIVARELEKEESENKEV